MVQVGFEPAPCQLQPRRFYSFDNTADNVTAKTKRKNKRAYAEQRSIIRVVIHNYEKKDEHSGPLG